MAEDKVQQKDNENSEENLWASVLSEVQTSRSSQLPASKNLLVLGDKESGKTTLVAKLQGNEDPKKGAGLEYGYIDVRDEYRDDHTRLGHWILDGDLAHSHLLRFALKESNFTDTTVLLCVAMTTPWNVMDQLQNWATLLHDHIDKLTLSAEETKRLQNENIRRWQSYTEPGDETDTGSPSKRISRNMDQSFSERSNVGVDDDILPLPEDTLARNLGLDLIVVVTKTDFMADLERDYDYKEEHFDFIQQSIRSFCLQFGAALFYVSVKEDKNCDLLYKYLVHRIYRFPFKTPALVVEKDAVFIPAGWDSSKKIAILHENMHSMKPDQYFTDVIARPMAGLRGIHGKAATDKPRHELEVTAEDEQQFLMRQQQYLQQGAQPGMAPQGGMPGNTMGAGIPKTPNRKDMGSPGVQGSPTKKATYNDVDVTDDSNRSNIKDLDESDSDDSTLSFNSTQTDRTWMAEADTTLNANSSDDSCDNESFYEGDLLDTSELNKTFTVEDAIQNLAEDNYTYVENVSSTTALKRRERYSRSPSVSKSTISCVSSSSYTTPTRVRKRSCTPQITGNTLTPLIENQVSNATLNNTKYNLRDRRKIVSSYQKWDAYENPVIDTESPNTFGKLVKKLAKISDKNSKRVRQAQRKEKELRASISPKQTKKPNSNLVYSDDD